MKYLSDYMKEKQTKLFAKHKVFFAFSQKQLEEGLATTDQRREDITSFGGGMYGSKTSADAFVDELERLIVESIAEDVKENGIENVVKRELANHEAYYTGDIESTMEALEMYPVNRDYVQKIFRQTQRELQEV